MTSQMEVYYLYHSGFAVRLNNKLLIFDYYSNQADNQSSSLYNGIVDPDAHRNDQVFVFSSHKHHDHFNPVIFQWAKQIPNVQYILSSDIPLHGKKGNILVVKPDQHYQLPGMEIYTLASTDEGVAFIIQTGGKTIYHAGDLHWWYWDGEPDPWNPQMEEQYKKQIARMKQFPIDVAFVPVDPRQEDYSTLGLEWYLKEISCSHVFPMHFGNDFTIMDKINSSPELTPYLDKIHCIFRRGQNFMIN